VHSLVNMLPVHIPASPTLCLHQRRLLGRRGRTWRRSLNMAEIKFFCFSVPLDQFYSETKMICYHDQHLSFNARSVPVSLATLPTCTDKKYTTQQRIFLLCPKQQYELIYFHEADFFSSYMQRNTYEIQFQKTCNRTFLYYPPPFLPKVHSKHFIKRITQSRESKHSSSMILVKFPTPKSIW